MCKFFLQDFIQIQFDLSEPSTINILDPRYIFVLIPGGRYLPDQTQRSRPELEGGLHGDWGARPRPRPDHAHDQGQQTAAER